MIEVATGKPIWAIGFMTGTSMDGVDGALIKTDGETIFEFGATHFEYIPDEAEITIVKAMDWAEGMRTDDLTEHRASGFEGVYEIEMLVETMTQAHLVVIDELITMSGSGSDADSLGSIIGVHGQTILHRPLEGFTLQIEPDTSQFPLPCITDFRRLDLDAGGEGAPLAPFYHFALAKFIGATEPVAFLNIGGVGNVTWIDPVKATPSEDGALMAFDTGPGNALINDWMGKRTGEEMDSNGMSAATGRIHPDRLVSNSAQAYLDRRPPKSLDRNEFHGVLGAVEGLTTNDGAATLTAFTADCVAESVRHMPSPPSRWLVCGGGRHNNTMMRMLQDRLDAPVEPVEAVGLDGDMLEAQAFAYLAVRVLRGLPTSAPSTTGCREPVCGGRISYPA
ncbi:MAG: anhydro-N-acetylmuramic acid kinase [Pseudomonadota bacterium]